ncbi:hypothetical protein HK405_012027, partial [Cladochytrium tenue]
MSYAYQTEPPTKGKVILKTSYGDIEVELWPKEAPKAVRNFVQLSLEGYYDGTVFHRIVKEFIAQGGDPTGTGQGGESIYGAPFSDEIHSRLRFSHRGLLACANTGRNANGSQFFFTLDKCEELNGKNTIFGKVVGNTVFNLLKLGESETDDNERPLYPPKLISVEVLSNPFDDIEPRVTPEERAAARLAAEQKAAGKDKPQSKIKAPTKRKLNLLSFDDEEFTARSKPKQKVLKSSHDLLDTDLLRKETAVSKDELDRAAKQNAAAAASASRRDHSEEEDGQEKSRPKQSGIEKVYIRGERSKESKAAEANLKSQIEQMQNEIRQMDAARRVSRQQADDERRRPASSVDQFRSQYAGKGATVGRRQKGTDGDVLARLEGFRSKLLGAEGGAAGGGGGASADAVF